MKILCLGDVHLGASPDLGRVPFGEGSRLHDQARVLNRIANLAHDEGVDLCLFAGDAFHRRRPTPSEILTWRRFVDRLNTLGIDVIACDGNHDVESADRPSALETVRTHSGYEVSRTPQVFLPTPQIAVATLPWTPPARLLASLNSHVERDEVSARVAELLIDTARELRAQIPEGKTSVLLCHWSVSGSSLPNELPVDLLREPVLPLPDLHALGFDVVVLGHIHLAQLLTPAAVIDRDPESGLSAILEPGRSLVFYTGSPAVVDWGETGHRHGVMILDTETSSAKQLLIEDRRFVTVECDLTTERHADLGLDETDAIAAAIATHFPLTDAVVRIRYRATSEQARRVDTAAIRKLCADAGVSKVFAVQPDVVREDRARAEGITESLSVPEALELSFEADPPVSPERAEALRVLAAELLEGVGA